MFNYTGKNNARQYKIRRNSTVEQFKQFYATTKNVYA